MVVNRDDRRASKQQSNRAQAGTVHQQAARIAAGCHCGGQDLMPELSKAISSITDNHSRVRRQHPSGCNLGRAANFNDIVADQGLIDTPRHYDPDDGSSYVTAMSWPGNGCIYKIIARGRVEKAERDGFEPFQGRDLI
jgi:hypothetical protein